MNAAAREAAERDAGSSAVAGAPALAGVPSGLVTAGQVSAETRLYTRLAPFELESGAFLPAFLPETTVAYRTWGELADGGDNAVLVCHALTGSADVDAWWPALLGPGRALDPERDFIVASNVLGSCYGSSGPLTPPVAGLAPWGPDFPAVSIRDMVRLQALLLAHLGVRRLRLVVGGSLGGMQVLEWAALYPERVAAIAPLATSGRHSAWCIGLSAVQRQAIVTDPRFRGGRYPADDPPAAGLAVARMVAMLSYRSRASLEDRFGRQADGESQPTASFAVAGYLDHQGRKLVDRFDANAYLTLLRAMDSHDLGRGRGRYEQVLRSLGTPALVGAIDSDVLYPPIEQRELASLLPHAELAWIRSPHGHDAFLIEGEQVNRMLVAFRRRVEVGAPGAQRVPRECLAWSSAERRPLWASGF